MTNIGLILVALGFVFLNGFFVMAEFAMVKLRYTRVQMLKNTAGWRGTILAKIHTNLDAYLSACQLGITLASLGLGWIGEPAFAHLLTPILKLAGITSLQIITIVSISVAFFIISFLHIVVGELMPKSMAIRQSEKMSLWTAIPLYSFYWLMYPVIYLLNTCANLLLKLFKLDAVNHGEYAYSSEEIKLILKSSHLHGELEQDEAYMIENTLDFADLQVSDIMRPLDELISLDNSLPITENLSRMMAHRYSRYPVYQDNIQSVIGIVHAKDYLAPPNHPEAFPALTDKMGPQVKIAPSSSVLALLQKFKEGGTHMALVYQRGQLIGFLTLDNLLQGIVGHIKDEFHFTKDDWQMLKDGGFRLKGHTSLYTLEQALNLTLPDYAETTISGLILEELARLPEVNERIDFNHFYAIIEEIAGDKIKHVRVYPKPQIAKV